MGKTAVIALAIATFGFAAPLDNGPRILARHGFDAPSLP